jgi:transcriptional regulator with XRE-family HTH domain
VQHARCRYSPSTMALLLSPSNLSQRPQSDWAAAEPMMQKSRRKEHGANRRTGSIDTHVGERLRQRRVIRGLSLDELASKLDVSAQQLQKYEAGHNRITASRLYQCAAALDVPISSFYIGLPEPSSQHENHNPQALPPTLTGHINVQEVGELLRIFSSIDDPKLRRKIIELVDAFAATLRSAA